MEAYQTEVFTILAVLVFVLASYLGYLMSRLKLQKQVMHLRDKQLQEERAKRIESIRESLRIISLAVIQEQCEISEGCIRIKKLLDQLEDLKKQVGLSVIDDLYGKIEHFAILEERKNLSKQEKFDQDKERFQIEDDYREQFILACKELYNGLRVQ